LHSTVLSNFAFKTATPDVSSVVVTTRSENDLEKHYELVVVSSMEPKVDVKLGKEIATDPVKIIDIDKIPDSAYEKIPITPEEKKLPQPDDAKQLEPDGKWLLACEQSRSFTTDSTDLHPLMPECTDLRVISISR
jgi:hypothetical protein